jgi:hypothetical protein
VISIIVYGRNDSYGYNLHKRAALSLNNFGHILGRDDEIIFVDYNTPSGFPTFPEAIADTLTPRAKRLLRVLRVSSEQHSSLAPKTHLKTLEPLARNVGLRRSNSNNKWVLSTNTDMLFVPRNNTSLSDTVARLDDGHFGLPRFEVPEGLWEGLNRSDPEEGIHTLDRWASQFHLQLVAESWLPHRFDAPGDFQLLLRKDLVAIHGFNQQMVLGWHVDSNISKRVSVIRGEAQDFSPYLQGFHCDHTRQETPMHKSGAVQNSTFRFIDSVTSSVVKGQEDWGLKGVDVEEIRLDRSFSNRLVEVLHETIQPQKSTPPTRRYNASGYDVDPPHDSTVVTFLLDLVASHGPRPRILWLGPRSEILNLFLEGIKKLSERVDFHGAFPERLIYTRAELRRVPERYGFDFVVFDLRAFWAGVPDIQGRRHTELLSLIRRWWSGKFLKNSISAEPQLIAIDAINTSVETEFNLWVSCGRTPYSIGISHGVLRERRGNISLWQVFGKRYLSGLRRLIIGDENVASWVSKRFGFRTMTVALRRGYFEEG